MIELNLRGGEVTFVDDVDSWALGHQWYLNRTSDNRVYVRCRKIGYLHRLIMKPPKYKVVDHISGDTLDNRRSNLRVVIAKHNSTNRPRNWRSTSEFKGVTPGRSGKWRAQIKNDGKCIYIGEFSHPAIAAVAYDKKAIELWGDFAYTNFPKEIHVLIKDPKQHTISYRINSQEPK